MDYILLCTQKYGVFSIVMLDYQKVSGAECFSMDSMAKELLICNFRILWWIWEIEWVYMAEYYDIIWVYMIYGLHVYNGKYSSIGCNIIHLFENYGGYGI